MITYFRFTMTTGNLDRYVRITQEYKSQVKIVVFSVAENHTGFKIPYLEPSSLIVALVTCSVSTAAQHIVKVQPHLPPPLKLEVFFLQFEFTVI